MVETIKIAMDENEVEQDVNHLMKIRKEKLEELISKRQKPF